MCLLQIQTELSGRIPTKAELPVVAFELVETGGRSSSVGSHFAHVYPLAPQKLAVCANVPLHAVL